jgi:tol-pal system protein YbgF
MSGRCLLWAFLLAFSLLALQSVAGTAQAQDQSLKGLIDRVDRLQRELQTLQRQVYRGEPPPEAAQGLAGDLAPGGNAVARLELRLSELEGQIRLLTGQVEEATFRNRQLEQRLVDVETRLEQTENKLYRDGLAGEPGQDDYGSTAAFMGAEAPAEGDDPTLSGEGAGAGTVRTLGTVPAEALGGSAAQNADAAITDGASQSASLDPAASSQQAYDRAFGLLGQGDYGAAEVALSDFLAAYPDDPLAGNAKYWLGETYYVRGDYQQAAVTFAEAYQDFPNSSKAPDNLLKLGLSLAGLGNSADACGTLAELPRRHPNAAASILQRGKQELQKLGCQ